MSFQSTDTVHSPGHAELLRGSGTAALLVNDSGEYLLHLRAANKPIWRAGHWCLLGGRLDAGESNDDCIRRELQEEIGLVVEDLVPFRTRDTVDANGVLTNRVHVYLGTLNRAVHEIELREGIQLRWTRIDETAAMTMDPATMATLDEHRRLPQPLLDGSGMPAIVKVTEPDEHRDRSIVGAHLVLVRDNAVLLGQRHPDSAFAPGAWHLPAGHREAGESALACMVRETAEEAGLTMVAEDLRLAHTWISSIPAAPRRVSSCSSPPPVGAASRACSTPSGAPSGGGGRSTPCPSPSWSTPASRYELSPATSRTRRWGGADPSLNGPAVPTLLVLADASPATPQSKDVPLVVHLAG
ncbi:NUDIX domain-containing protein [Streptomyces sp. NPDC005271]|uniref:NUDIX domain-containing protein n=1 Tax=unclassified Streptomyces TaxID=2593676 RepID=UPI0033B1F48B